MKKNPLSIFALAKLGPVVKFVDEKCLVHDLSLDGTTMESSTLFCMIYKIDDCKNNVEILAS